MTEETDGCLVVGRVVELLMQSPRKPRKLGFDEICHKPMHLDSYPGLESPTAAYCHDEDINPERYRQACPLVPGIVTEGAPNPCGARYRMLDGRHRICNLKLNFPHLRAAWFFVVKWEEIEALISTRAELGTVSGRMEELGGTIERITQGRRQDAAGKAYPTSLVDQVTAFVEASRMRRLHPLVHPEPLCAADKMAQMMDESTEKGGGGKGGLRGDRPPGGAKGKAREANAAAEL